MPSAVTRIPLHLPPRTAPPGETGADRPGRARGSDAEPDATRTVGPDEPRVVRAVVGGLHRGRATDRAGGRAPARVRCRHWMGRAAMARRTLVHRYTGRRVAAAGDPGDGPHPLSAGHRRVGGAHELLRGHRPAGAADHPGAQVDPVRDAVRRLTLVGGGRRRHGGVQRPGLARRAVAVRPRPQRDDRDPSSAGGHRACRREQLVADGGGDAHDLDVHRRDAPAAHEQAGVRPVRPPRGDAGPARCRGRGLRRVRLRAPPRRQATAQGPAARRHLPNPRSRAGRDGDRPASRRGRRPDRRRLRTRHAR